MPAARVLRATGVRTELTEVLGTGMNVVLVRTYGVYRNFGTGTAAVVPGKYSGYGCCMYIRTRQNTTLGIRTTGCVILL